MVTLSRAVAVAMVHGPKAGLALLGTLASDERLAHGHRPAAVRAHLLERAGDPVGAREAYVRAAKLTASQPEQRLSRASRGQTERARARQELDELNPRMSSGRVHLAHASTTQLACRSCLLMPWT
jgi:hypothetical protein